MKENLVGATVEHLSKAPCRSILADITWFVVNDVWTNNLLHDEGHGRPPHNPDVQALPPLGHVPDTSRTHATHRCWDQCCAWHRWRRQRSHRPCQVATQCRSSPSSESLRNAREEAGPKEDVQGHRGM